MPQAGPLSAPALTRDERARRPPAPPAGLALPPIRERRHVCGSGSRDRLGETNVKSSVPDAGCCPPAAVPPPWAPWALCPLPPSECLTSCSEGLRGPHDSTLGRSWELPPALQSFQSVVSCGRAGRASALASWQASPSLCSASRPS